VIERVRRYILDRRLLVPGDRIAVAVSGGADSVALLRVLLQVREELGVVLSVAHFHHGIRGAEADADQQFVSELANRFGLEFHLGAGDAPVFARESGLSLETAARELRHGWFAALLAEGKADKVATAHTLDDQAETVLMRIIRGTGSRGLSGISPLHSERKLVRPFLQTSRREIEQYLRNLKQLWRDDSTNQNLAHTRNRVRHELLLLLEQHFNPAIRQNLSDLAEVARGEAEYWEREMRVLATRLLRPGKPSRSGRSTSGKAATTLALDLDATQSLPLAVQRQLFHHVAAMFGITLEFNHVEELTEMARYRQRSKKAILPGGLMAISTFREIQFSLEPAERNAAGYACTLPVPGEVAISPLGSTVRARVITPGASGIAEVYNPALLLDRALLHSELVVRNWRAGDRYFPAHTKAPRKIKELLQAGRLGRPIAPAERQLWPVVECAGEIVWLRGFPVPEAFAYRSGDAVLIEEVKITSGAEL
jgi:tRNA(Ile)-lysidine synthase